MSPLPSITIGEKTGARRLELDALNDDADNIPSEELQTIQELRINNMPPEIDRLYSFISRSPNVVSLICSKPSGPIPKTNVPADTVPQLRLLTSPLAVAQTLVLGRPLEAITVTAPPGSHREGLGTMSEILPSLATGTGVVRTLQLCGFAWDDQVMDGRILELFPDLQDIILTPQYIGSGVPKVCPPLPDPEFCTEFTFN